MNIKWHFSVWTNKLNVYFIAFVLYWRCLQKYIPTPSPTLHLVIGIANNKNKKHNNINCTDFLLLLFIELEQFSFLFFVGDDFVLCVPLLSFVFIFFGGGREVEGRLNKYSHVWQIFSLLYLCSHHFSLNTIFIFWLNFLCKHLFNIHQVLLQLAVVVEGMNWYY